MDQIIGTPTRPIRVAVVGAGPAGFYTTIALLQDAKHHILVDMFERLPVPYGLVRHGVAPDHLSIKNVTQKYAVIFNSGKVRLFGNVEYGKDLTHAEMKAHYDAIAYTVGAQTDRRLGVNGEDLEGSMSATEFVAWYNGHPDFANLKVHLETEHVAVIGMGNVALDVARLLAKSGEELHPTDMATHAVHALRESHVAHIHIIGRRGPAQAKWTTPELKEMGELAEADVLVNPDDLILDETSQAELASDKMAAKQFGILQQFSQKEASGKKKTVHFHFLKSPIEILGEDGKVVGLTLVQNKLEGGKLRATDATETLPASMILRSVGYVGVALPDVPFDHANGVIPNQKGRIQEQGTIVPFEYVSGWIKRGATGVIGTNKADGYETAACMLEDLATHTFSEAPKPDIQDLLHAKDIHYVSYEGWEKINNLELTTGATQNRPRVKVVHAHEMVHIAKKDG